MTSNGKFQCEEKYELRKRGIASPNRADAVLGAMAPRDYNPEYTYTDYVPWNANQEMTGDRSVLSKIGASAGCG
jgi:hypothetical protein